MEVISSTANLQKIIGITAGKFKNVLLHGQISDNSSNLHIRVGLKIPTISGTDLLQHIFCVQMEPWFLMQNREKKLLVLHNELCMTEHSTVI